MLRASKVKAAINLPKTMRTLLTHYDLNEWIKLIFGRITRLSITPTATDVRFISRLAFAQENLVDWLILDRNNRSRWRMAQLPRKTAGKWNVNATLSDTPSSYSTSFPSTTARRSFQVIGVIYRSDFSTFSLGSVSRETENRSASWQSIVLHTKKSTSPHEQAGRLT